jgi:simple sugar transport system permease protein
MNHSTVIQLITVAIVAGTPMVFVAVGELLAQRAGVMNLGLEGMMLMGAVIAYLTTVTTHSTWLGLLAGAAAGVAMAAIHATLSITLRANQIVSGIALVILGAGLSQFIGSEGSTPLTTRPSGGSFGPLLSGGLADWPIVGPILFGQDVLVYLSWVLVAATAFYLFRTRWGLWLRAVGEDPASADAVGISVARVRWIHVLFGGATAGVGGAYLTLALFSAWQDNLSAGQGWIAFAIVIFCGRRPLLALAAAYLFGALTGIGFKLQLFHLNVPTQILSMLPFVVTLVALLIVSSGRFGRIDSEPAALGEPYWRESR